MNSTELVSCKAGMRGVVPTAVRRAELGGVCSTSRASFKVGEPEQAPLLP